MKRIIVLLFSILSIYAGTCFADSEEQPSSLSWVIEKRSVISYTSDGEIYYDYECDEDGNYIITNRVIKTLDFSTGEVCEEEVPVEWIPLRKSADQEGLLFAVISQEQKSAEIICWRNGSLEILEKALPVSEDLDPIAYVNGCLYLQKQEYDPKYEQRTTTLARSKLSGIETMRLYDCGNYDYEYYPCVSDEMQLTRFVPVSGYSLLTMNGMEHRRNISFVAAPECASEIEAPTQYGQDTLLIWSDVTDIQELGSISIYLPLYAENGQSSYQTELPLLHKEVLQKIEMNSGALYPFRTENGEQIVLENLEALDGSTYINPSTNTLYVVCEDNCPVNNGTERIDIAYRCEGRRVLVQIDLDTGKQEIVYETGYTQPDYEAMLALYLKEYGAPLPEGELSIPLSEEDQAAEREVRAAKPLEGSLEKAAEFFVENFSVDIVWP